MEPKRLIPVEPEGAAIAALLRNEHCWHELPMALTTMHGMRAIEPQEYDICCNCGLQATRITLRLGRPIPGHGPHARTNEYYAVQRVTVGRNEAIGPCHG